MSKPSLLRPASSFLPVAEGSAPLRGRYELHYTKGWPDGEAFGLRRCEEHGETCGKRVTLIEAAVVRYIIFDGDGPFHELG